MLRSVVGLCIQLNGQQREIENGGQNLDITTVFILLPRPHFLIFLNCEISSGKEVLINS